MQRKRAWVLVALLALMVVVLVISRSQALPSAYKGLTLPTPRPVEGFTEALPPPVWLIAGDKAVIGTLAAGGTSRGHADPAYALPDLPIASLLADAPAVIVVGSESVKSFKATVRPWSEDGRIVPLYDDTARELKAEVQREENLTVFTLESTGDAGDQLLNVNITFPVENAWAFYLWRLNPAQAPKLTVDQAATATPSPVATTLPSVEIPTSCVAHSEDRAPYFNLADGYCLLYPAHFRVSDVRPGLAGFYGPPLDQTIEPVFGALSILVEGPAAGRTLAQVADHYVSVNRSGEGTAVTRSTATLGGEPAEIVEGRLDAVGSRQVFVLHNDTIYQLGVYPVDEAFPQAAPYVAAVWQAVSTSFTFLPEGIVAGFSSCPDGNDNAAPYLNLTDGYCLLYPSRLGVSVQVASHGVVFSGWLSEPGAKPVMIDLVIHAGESANGRSAAQVATDYLAQYPADVAAQVVRTPIRVEGQPGEMVDGVPGRTQTRRAFVVYNDRVYEFTLSPYNDPASQTYQAEADAAWRTVTASFVFVTVSESP